MSSLLRIRHHVGDYPAGITSTMMEAAEMWMNWITTGPTSGLKIQDCNFQSYSFLCHFPAFCFHLSKCYWSFHLLFSSRVWLEMHFPLRCLFCRFWPSTSTYRSFLGSSSSDSSPLWGQRNAGLENDGSGSAVDFPAGGEGGDGKCRTGR